MVAEGTIHDGHAENALSGFDDLAALAANLLEQVLRRS